MVKKEKESKELKRTVEVEPLPNLYKLSEWLSVNETLKVAGKEHAASLTGKDRYADRYELRTLRIGGTRVYLAKDVREMAIDINVGQATGKEDRKEARSAAIKRYNKMMAHVKATRNVDWHEYVDINEAMQIVAPNITTREAIYRLTDYRNNGGGVIRTVQIGRTHMYLRRNIEDVKYQKHVRNNRKRVTRLRTGMAEQSS